MDASEPPETFLTVAEVAEMLKLNQQTVRNWIDQGSMPAVRVGRRVRIKQSDFDRVIARSYDPGGGRGGQSEGPSADDFWGGTPVGLAEPGEGAPGAGESAGTESGGQVLGAQAPGATSHAEAESTGDEGVPRE